MISEAEIEIEKYIYLGFDSFSSENSCLILEGIVRGFEVLCPVMFEVIGKGNGMGEGQIKGNNHPYCWTSCGSGASNGFGYGYGDGCGYGWGFSGIGPGESPGRGSFIFQGFWNDSGRGYGRD